MYKNELSGEKPKQTDAYSGMNHSTRALVFCDLEDTSPPRRATDLFVKEFGVLRMWYHDDQPAVTLQVHAKDVEHFNKILAKLSAVCCVVDVRFIVSEPISRKGWRFDDEMFVEEQDAAESEVAEKLRGLYGN